MADEVTVFVKGQGINVNQVVGYYCHCDNCGRGTDQMPYEQDPSRFSDALEAAEWALENGWEAEDGDLFCPECLEGRKNG